jgi:general nucleoside transport system ATP-binding protein
MRGIVRRFPGVVANDHVDFTLEAGEIHALLGENGAGKSTLMQVLYGFHRLDAGEIFMRGERVRISSPKDAISLGIGMVHQEFMLVHPFTVVENVVLGLKQGRVLDLKSAARRLRDLSSRHHLQIDPGSRVSTLPIGVQQRVEILKLLYRDASVIILDEPTAVLTPLEKDHLFAVLRGLRAEGRSIVIVTHKLNEIMELADRVTVMRDGRVVATRVTDATSADELARLMVGRDVNLHANRTKIDRGPCVLSIADLHVKDESGQEKVRGVTLDVYAGEIVGIAGVDGNGQSQLAQAILNLLTTTQGEISLRGQDVTDLSVAEHRALGISYVSADRRRVGSVAELSITDNAILGSQRSRLRGLFIDRVKVKAHAQALVQRFGVRAASIDTPVRKLSGGNLQKVILGREILHGLTATRTGVMIVEQPTRGLDVGAIEAVWRELLRERERGTAILLISAELEELLNLADRIAVMYAGKIVGIVDAREVSVQDLGMMMTDTPVPKQSSPTVMQPGDLHA